MRAAIPPPERLALGRLLDLWEHLVDSQVGIVREISELPLDEDDPNFFHFLSRSCDVSRFNTLRNFGNNGGVSTNRYVALAKALGEAVERYSSALFDYDRLLIAEYASLPRRATPPSSFALYAPEQHAEGGSHFPWEPFLPTSPVAWTEGVSLAAGEPVLVPAAMVFVPYHYMRSRGDAAIVQPISTGLAAGSSFAEAALSGLCEVIERDAFTITWQARLRHPRIDLATLPAGPRDLIRRYEEVGLRVEVMDITSDLPIPTLLTFALGERETSPAVTVAAATDPSAERALTKSLEELAHTRKFAKQLMDYTPEVPNEVDQGHPRVQDQKDHLRLYCPQQAKAWAEFAWSSDEVRNFAEVRDYPETAPLAALSRLASDLAAAGLEAIACDLTSPDVRALGLSVVRMVVPGMNPLFMGHSNRALGGTRLYTVPQRLGYPGLSPGAPDNPYPHPFP